MFDGQSLRLAALPGDEGWVELCFDRRDDSINKLDERTVEEFRQAVALLAAAAAAQSGDDGDAHGEGMVRRDRVGLRGVLVSSAKDVFIVGADITEFSAMFDRGVEAIAADVFEKNRIFSAFEDLPVPTVVAINGVALGGGLELALAASLRVMSSAAQVGLPEVKLGLFPGFGGTVRLSRVAGLETAVEWVAGGKSFGAEAARDVGVVDEVAEPAALREAALALLRRAADGQVDWRTARQRKREPAVASTEVVEALVAARRPALEEAAARHRPAALAALGMMARGAALRREGALRLEADAFAAVTQTQAARGLVRVFLGEQSVKKAARRHRAAAPVRQLAVLGAGVMGGGIAATALLTGTPVRLKDIAPAALDAGVGEAARLVQRQVRHHRLTGERAATLLSQLHAQTDNAGFGEVDLVIEAIVERLEVKRRVLAELEGALREDAVIASNTSSLRIADIATALSRPERLVGLHFFNPVPVMPLVEVIRGPATSEAAVALAVGQVLAMGKTPIVVRDCPGFLVNRIVTPYVQAFSRLVADGADFVEVDRVMEAFGWPMGPAWLQDVVGMDVGLHVGDVISAGYPDRMGPVDGDPIRAMVAEGRYGQKSGRGFYRHIADAAGKPRKEIDPQARALVAGWQRRGERIFDADVIVERLMLPMIVEAARALEEGVVDSAAALDMALLLGLGFPAHAGGVLAYADWLGLDRVVARCDAWASLGAACHATDRMRRMAAEGARFHDA